MGILDILKSVIGQTAHHGNDPLSPDPAQQRPGKGILGAIGDIVAPEAGSFWWSAMHGGLANARETQRQYPLMRQQEQMALEGQKVGLDTAKHNLDVAQTTGQYKPLGGNAMLRIKPDGTSEIITTPKEPGEQERLIELYRNEKDPNMKEMLERTIRGYQYSGDYIGAKTNATIKTNTAKAAAGAKYRAPKAAQPVVPQGWSVVGGK